MINKFFETIENAVAQVKDGSTIMISGFRGAGRPAALIDALITHGARDLTVIHNNAGNGEDAVAALLLAGRVSKIICSFPRQADGHVFAALYREKRIELDLRPQGTLAECIRAGGAGIGAFYTPTACGTILAEDKEIRVIAGRPHVLEYALNADFAFIKADVADRWGNLLYRKTARNFGPIMAMAARHTVVQVSKEMALGELDPEAIVTPGIYVKSVVQIKETT